MPKRISNSLDDTILIAKEFSKFLKPGYVVCFTGDLGAGKTTFISAVAKALNFSDTIISPTFNILIQYKNNRGLELNHFDLYRLESQDQLEDIAFYEIIEGNGISFIEWADKFIDEMPKNSIKVIIKKLDENSREIIW